MYREVATEVGHAAKQLATDTATRQAGLLAES